MSKQPKTVKCTIGPKLTIGGYHAKTEDGRNIFITGKPPNKLDLEEGQEVTIKRKPSLIGLTYKDFIKLDEIESPVYVMWKT